jgi:pimeloyl-ACP methyl ester carboxylesterase
MIRTGLSSAVIGLALVATGCSAPFQAGDLPADPGARRFADVGGFRLHHDVRGTGPTVLFLHGFSSFLQAWDGEAGALAATHKCILVDLPGHGLSDRRPGDYTPDGVARKVLALLDSLGERRVSIVAHSWGASVALAIALAAPERVDRIAIVDGWMYDAQANLFMQWARAPGFGDGLWGTFWDQHVEARYGMAFKDPERWYDERAIRYVRKVMAIPGTEAATLAVIRGLGALPALERRYGEVKAPALLVWCREDTVSPPRWGERLANDLGGARLEVIPECGHMPMVEQPARLHALLSDFLAAPAAGGAR